MVAMIRSFERFMRVVAQSLEVLTDRDAQVTTFGARAMISLTAAIVSAVDLSCGAFRPSWLRQECWDLCGSPASLATRAACRPVALGSRPRPAALSSGRGCRLVVRCCRFWRYRWRLLGLLLQVAGLDRFRDDARWRDLRLRLFRSNWKFCQNLSASKRHLVPIIVTDFWYKHQTASPRSSAARSRMSTHSISLMRVRRFAVGPEISPRSPVAVISWTGTLPARPSLRSRATVLHLTAVLTNCQR